MKITFHGAAGEVTGSKHLIETAGKSILLDCGMHQGRRKLTHALNSVMPFNPKTIDAVILSHSHLDHCGMLPVLVRDGFKGDIFSTTATADIAKYILQDSARIQEQDIRYYAEKLRNDHDPEIVPLYTEEDAVAVQHHFKPTPYYRLKPHWTNISNDIKFKLLDAGHILGSSMPVIKAQENDSTLRVGFTGDIGKPNNPLLWDPEPFREELDVLIMESTYGNRNHKTIEEAIEILVHTINESVAKKGKIIIPAFALGRTQHLIYILHKLTDEKRIPRLPIYIDSPLAINITEVFKRHEEDYNLTAENGFINVSEDPLSFRNLEYLETRQESKMLNDKPGPFIVIASSGMCEGGRIVHHLDQHISDPKATVIITGYQAEHTLGRKIQDGISPVRFFGSPHKVRARVITLDEFSAHADHDTMLKYLETIPKPKQIFLVHGELDQSEKLKAGIEGKFPQIKVTVPERGQSFQI